MSTKKTEPDDVISVVVPEDLGTLSAGDLEGLRQNTVAAFNELYDGGNRTLTAEDEETLSTLKDIKLALDAEKASRSAAAAARATNAAEFATAFSADSDEDEGDEKAAPAEEEEEEEEEEDEAKEENPDAIVATAVSQTFGPINVARMKAKQTPALPTAEKALSPYRGGSQAPNLRPGAVVTFDAIADEFAEMTTGTRSGPVKAALQSGARFSQKFKFADIHKEFDPRAVVGPDNTADSAIAFATDQSRLPGGSLVAAGGWCFGAGTLVNTPEGLVAIEDLRQDDMVLNDEGQAKRVALVLTRETQKHLLRAHGAQTETTPEHPMWARRRRLTKGGRKTSLAQGMFAWDAAAWVPAGELAPGDLVAFASDVLVGTESPTTPERAYLLGRYIGDGWTSRTRKGGGGRNDMDSSFLCSSHGEADSLEKAIVASEFGYSRREYPTVTQFKMHADFRDWVADLGAGRGAHEKVVPAQVFSWSEDLRQAVLNGYTDADGHLRTSRAGSSPRMSTSTVSRALAVSCAQLARTLGFSPGIKVKPAPKSTIDGRELRGSVNYVVDWTCGTQAKARHLRHDGMVWEVVQSFTPTEFGRVWDITVDDPKHSFIADGMVVHNCAPSETLYDLCELESRDGLYSLPEIRVNRGGIRFTQGPDWVDIFATTGFCFDETADIAGSYALTNEINTLTEGGAGLTSYTLTVNGQTTASIDDDATAVEVQAALVALSNVGPADVVVTGTTNPIVMRIAWQGALAGTNITISSTPTGGTGTVVVGTVQEGGQPGGGKPCAVVPCPTFSDVRLQVCGTCIQAGFLMDRAYPELIRRYVKGALTAHAHRVDTSVVNAVIAGSTAVTVPALVTPAENGTAAPILSAIELQAEDLRYKRRMSRGMVLEAVFPFWVRGAIRADLSRRLGVDLLRVTDADIGAWFRSRGVNAQFVYNFDALGAPAAAVAWPTSLRFLIYAAGTWVKGSADVITINMLHDSALNSFNNFTAIFAEEGWSVMKMCHESRIVTVPICVAGGTNSGAALDCTA